MAKRYKIIVFVPESHGNDIRKAMGKAGAGKIGNYTFCSFTTKGTGRFKPETGARPSIGKIGNLESVEEERIEALVDEDFLQKVITEIKRVHPYEEVALDVYPLEDV